VGQDRGSATIREQGPIARIEVDVDAGAVEVVGLDGRTGADGAIESRWTNQSPEIVHYLEKGVLHILGRCQDLAPACRTDVTLQVPVGVNVGISSGRGDLTVRGVSGDVELNTGYGDLTLQNDDGSIIGETGVGDIDGQGLTSHLVDVRTMTGDVSLDVLVAPLRLDAHTEDGDVDLIVPAGPYRVEGDAANGDVQVSPMVVSDAAAKNVIAVHSGRGDIRVGGREEKPLKQQRRR
jgi:hypothetical protein